MMLQEKSPRFSFFKRMNSWGAMTLMIIGVLKTHSLLAESLPLLSQTPASTTVPASKPLRWSLFGEFAPGMFIQSGNTNPDFTLEPSLLGNIGGRVDVVNTCPTNHQSCVQLALHLTFGAGGYAQNYIPFIDILAGFQEVLFIGTQRLVGWSIQASIGYNHLFVDPTLNASPPNQISFVLGSGVIFKATPALGLYVRGDYRPGLNSHIITFPVGVEYRF